MGVWPPAATAAHFEALWRSGFVEERLDGAFDVVVDIAAASIAGAAALVVVDGSRRWCAARSGALPPEWWGVETPEGWVRTAAAGIRLANGPVIAELVTFAETTQPVRNPPPPLMERLQRLIEELIARDAAEREASAVAVVDGEGILLDATSSLERLTGWSLEERLGTSVLELVHPADATLAAEGFSLSAQFPGRKTPMDLRLAGPDGRWVPVSVVATNRLDDPLIEAVIFEVFDTRARSTVDAVLAGQARILELVARGAPITDIAEAVVGLVESNIDDAQAWVASVDSDDRVLLPLTAPSSALLANHLHDVAVAPASLPAGVAVWRRQAVVVPDVEAHPLWEGAQVIARMAGIVADWAVPALSATGHPIGVVNVLLSRPGRPSAAEHRVAHLAAQLLAVALERHRAERQLAHQATHDPLTGLPNRAFLAHSLTDALIGKEHPHALLVCDIGGLDVVYRTFGHSAADELLTTIAERLCSTLRSGDLPCRLGDKQFGVLLDEASQADAIAIARRLLDAMTEPFSMYGREVFVDLHIGIATSEHPSDRLLLEADVALNRARLRRSSTFELFDPSMLQGMLEQVELEAELRRAVSRDELVVYYQPKIDLGTGEITGAEALVRWAHPRRGIVGPAEFVPLLEESGLIVPAGRRILERACRDAAEWPTRPAGAPMTVSVNASIRQLEEPAFASTVIATCEAASLPPTSLVVEITESVLSERHSQARTSLSELRDAGVALSIDDFGTGYSSLVRLRDFPISELKIDRSFVAEIEDEHQPAPIIAAVIAMAKGLGLRTIAEGVETDVQARLLHRLGCDHAQGYLYARPAPTLTIGAPQSM